MDYMQLSAVLLIVFLCFSSSLCPKDQSISLLNFKKSLTIDPSYDIFLNNFSKLSSWNTSSDCCLWDGVTCDEMSNYCLRYELNKHQLDFLSLIDLRSNFFGFIPSSTQYLFMSNNNLSEGIPSSVCNLRSLKVIDLAKNNLMGEIPECLGNVSSLEVFDMHLSGTIPTNFWRWKCMTISYMQGVASS